jgi:hypothetical protein
MAMLRVSNCPSQDLALTNCAFVNAADAKFIPHAEIGDVVLFVKPHPDVEPGALALNGVQRKLLRVSTGDTIRAEPFAVPSSQFTAAGMTLELEFTKLRTAAELNAVGRHEEVREIRPPISSHPSDSFVPSSRVRNSMATTTREGTAADDDDDDDDDDLRARFERDEYSFQKLELPSQARTFGAMEPGPLGAVANGFT